MGPVMTEGGAHMDVGPRKGSKRQTVRQKGSGRGKEKLGSSKREEKWT